MERLRYGSASIRPLKMEAPAQGLPGLRNIPGGSLQTANKSRNKSICASAPTTGITIFDRYGLVCTRSGVRSFSCTNTTSEVRSDFCLEPLPKPNKITLHRNNRASQLFMRFKIVRLMCRESYLLFTQIVQRSAGCSRLTISQYDLYVGACASHIFGSEPSIERGSKIEKMILCFVPDHFPIRLSRSTNKYRHIPLELTESIIGMTIILNLCMSSSLYLTICQNLQNLSQRELIFEQMRYRF